MMQPTPLSADELAELEEAWNWHARAAQSDGCYNESTALGALRDIQGTAIYKAGISDSSEASWWEDVSERIQKALEAAATAQPGTHNNERAHIENEQVHNAGDRE